MSNLPDWATNKVVWEGWKLFTYNACRACSNAVKLFVTYDGMLTDEVEDWRIKLPSPDAARRVADAAPLKGGVRK